VTADRLDTVRALLDQLGVSPEDLLGVIAPTHPSRTPMPTIHEYVDRVAGAVSPGAYRVYATYWRKVTEVWGQRRLDELTPTEVRELAEQVKAAAVIRRNSRGGRRAAEHLIAPLRCLYRNAEADGLIARERTLRTVTRLSRPPHAGHRCVPSDLAVRRSEREPPPRCRPATRPRPTAAPREDPVPR
jgi:integrase/recombinase XerC